MLKCSWEMNKCVLILILWNFCVRIQWKILVLFKTISCVSLCFLPKHLCFHVFPRKKDFHSLCECQFLSQFRLIYKQSFFYNTTSPNVYKLYSKSFSQISLRIIFDCWKKYFQKSFQNKQKRIAQNFYHCWSILLELWVSWFHSAFVPLV